MTDKLFDYFEMFTFSNISIKNYLIILKFSHLVTSVSKIKLQLFLLIYLFLNEK